MYVLDDLWYVRIVPYERALRNPSAHIKVAQRMEESEKSCVRYWTRRGKRFWRTASRNGTT